MVGAEIALRAGAGPVVAVAMGVITATFGGIVRDICFANARDYFGLELAPEFAKRK